MCAGPRLGFGDGLETVTAGADFRAHAPVPGRVADGKERRTPPRWVAEPNDSLEAYAGRFMSRKRESHPA